MLLQNGLLNICTNHLCGPFRTTNRCLWLISCLKVFEIVVCYGAVKPGRLCKTRTVVFAECFAKSLIYGTEDSFVISYSNVWVVRSVIRFDGARLSYALVRSNCNKLVITWPLGRLTDLSPSGASRPRVINQPAPEGPCYNYYIDPVAMVTCV